MNLIKTNILQSMFNSSFRLINIEKIMKHDEAYTVEDFHTICKDHIKNAVDILENQWLPLIKDIFVQVLYNIFMETFIKIDSFKYFYREVKKN